MPYLYFQKLNSYLVQVRTLQSHIVIIDACGLERGRRGGTNTVWILSVCTRPCLVSLWEKKSQPAVTKGWLQGSITRPISYFLSVPDEEGSQRINVYKFVLENLGEKVVRSGDFERNSFSFVCFCSGSCGLEN